MVPVAPRSCRRTPAASALRSPRAWRSISASAGRVAVALSSSPTRAPPPELGDPVPAIAGQQRHRVDHDQLLDLLRFAAAPRSAPAAPQSWTTSLWRPTPSCSRQRSRNADEPVHRVVEPRRIGPVRAPQPGRSIAIDGPPRRMNRASPRSGSGCRGRRRSASRLLRPGGRRPSRRRPLGSSLPQWPAASSETYDDSLPRGGDRRSGLRARSSPSPARPTTSSPIRAARWPTWPSPPGAREPPPRCSAGSATTPGEAGCASASGTSGSTCAGSPPWKAWRRRSPSSPSTASASRRSRSTATGYRRRRGRRRHSTRRWGRRCAGLRLEHPGRRARAGADARGPGGSRASAAGRAVRPEPPRPIAGEDLGEAVALSARPIEGAFWSRGQRSRRRADLPARAGGRRGRHRRRGDPLPARRPSHGGGPSAPTCAVVRGRGRGGVPAGRRGRLAAGRRRRLLRRARGRDRRARLGRRGPPRRCPLPRGGRRACITWGAQPMTAAAAWRRPRRATGAGDPRPAARDVRAAAQPAARPPDRRAGPDGPLPEHQRPQPRPRLRRLRERFPTWEEVRDAPVEEVEEAIRPGGLAQAKAPRIQAILERARRAEPDLDWLGGRPRARSRSTSCSTCPGSGAKPPPAC